MTVLVGNLFIRQFTFTNESGSVIPIIKKINTFL